MKMIFFEERVHARGLLLGRQVLPLGSNEFRHVRHRRLRVGLLDLGTYLSEASVGDNHTKMQAVQPCEHVTGLR